MVKNRKKSTNFLECRKTLKFVPFHEALVVTFVLFFLKSNRNGTYIIRPIKKEKPSNQSIVAFLFTGAQNQRLRLASNSSEVEEEDEPQLAEQNGRDYLGYINTQVEI